MKWSSFSKESESIELLQFIYAFIFTFMIVIVFILLLFSNLVKREKD